MRLARRFLPSPSGRRRAWRDQQRLSLPTAAERPPPQRPGGNGQAVMGLYAGRCWTNHEVKTGET
ncbi:hypothetical protein [Candidatus Entotheonella palauensis]|uniref:hypothetical protein n=1 Tax=Candidatus Entotheonella palauensis TaxID=93172 RepID=UPI0011773DF8|nr:hypothetical protein [Candidatus Entotheonella palauensis]